MTTKKAIILARVSTAGQAEEELPIESQVEASKAEAVRLGADVVKVFIEDGVSGRKVKRDIFQEAVDYCALFEIDYFILWNTARFARHRAIAAWTKFNLRKAGTEMVYVSQKINTATDEGWLLEGLFELMDENYSRTVSKDTMRSMMKNARDGFFNGGRVPFGYVAVADGKRKRLAILESEAMTVRRIFAECIGGAGTKVIALLLNQQGEHRRGELWTKNTVGYLLSNWVYAGYTVFNRRGGGAGKNAEEQWIKTKSHPAIVSEEEFGQVQKLLAMRAPETERGSVHSDFLLTGLAKCGLCGMGMQIMTGKGRGGVLYSYYQCAGALKGKGCEQRALRADVCDQVVIEQLTRELLTRERLEELAADLAVVNANFAKERQGQRTLLVRRLRAAEAKRRNLLDVLEQHGRSAPNLADIADRLRERNAEIKAVEADLDQLERAVPAPPVASVEIERLSTFMAGLLERGERRKVREFLSTFIEAIEIPKEGPAELRARPDRLLMPVRSEQKWLPE